MSHSFFLPSERVIVARGNCHCNGNGALHTKLFRTQFEIKLGGALSAQCRPSLRDFNLRRDHKHRSLVIAFVKGERR